jgi:hypothetical protein
MVVKNRNILIHMIRGLGNIPHVGNHPGIQVYIILLFVNIGASFIDGGTIYGFIITNLLYLPVLLIGSVSRSKLSDKLEQQKYDKFEEILLN